MSSPPPKFSHHQKLCSSQTLPPWLAFKNAFVKPYQRAALPMLRCHGDRGPLDHSFHPNPWSSHKPSGQNPLTPALTLLRSRKAGKIITRGFLFLSELHQEQLIPALLLRTYKTLSTYFASVSPPGRTGAMKETHFCMLEGKQRDEFHFSYFLLVELGNNKKTLRSGAAFKR